MDFGRKYMSRIFIYSSTFLAAYFVYAIIMLLNFFKLINLQLSILANMVAIYDIIVVLGIILCMFQFGAIINQ